MTLRKWVLTVAATIVVLAALVVLARSWSQPHPQPRQSPGAGGRDTSIEPNPSAPGPVASTRGTGPAEQPPPIAEYKPTPIELREHKPEGSRYRCSLTGLIQGEGTKEGFKTVTGTVQVYYATQLEWTVDVVKNDGETVVEKRHFISSRSTSILSAKAFGLTGDAVKAVDWAAGLIVAFQPEAAPQTALVVTAAELAKNDRLPKVPVIGPLLRVWAEEQAKKTPDLQALDIARELMGKLEGRNIYVTWTSGKLDEVRAEDNGELTESDKQLASKVSTFADFRVLPPDKKNPGDAWRIRAEDLVDFFYTDTDPGAKVSGWVTIKRREDSDRDRIAAVSGGGEAKIESKKVAATVELASLKGEMQYGGQNKFLRSTNAQGRAEYTRVTWGARLLGVKVSGKPTVDVTYHCESIQ